MPIFLELLPVAKDTGMQKKMYSIENIESIEDADIPGEEYARIIFNENSVLSEIVVVETYLDIYETLNNLNLVEEVIKYHE